jgi:OOP family OmpA-OmpF porin
MFRSVGFAIQLHFIKLSPDDANANLMLSKKRSESVRNLLISYGIDASRIKAGYFGELQPIAANATPEGRNKNRRIDFKFVMD